MTRRCSPVLACRTMDERTSIPDEAPPVEAQTQAQRQSKELWVTPVVREYDPAKVTRAFPNPGGADSGIYS
jgi:hypothetical protein